MRKSGRNVLAATATTRLSLVVAICILAAPFAAYAQQAGKLWRIGYFGASSPATRPFIDAFQQGLRELGYVDGQNIVIEYRSDAADLVRLKVDVLVASTNPRAMAAKNATTTIPIVMVNVADPVEIGLVASLARPGGNVTGLSRIDSELIGKNLELLAETVPGVSRVALLSDPVNPAHPILVTRAKQAAQSLGLQLLKIVETREPSELETAFSSMAKERVTALLVVAGGMLAGQYTRIADLALRNRLPSMSGSSLYPGAGGLMSYAPSSVAPYRRAATYVDKIFRGAKPADLPVEQPTEFHLVINLKTAKALGLTVPPSLLLRADQVIE